ncbi:hypothetical protein KFK09_015990 [Dendrobium nobile]|uniref:Uncharacterized protein n=1 Tax=Dendrobium nobile TaxID=94219 RepID=A0A8T3B8U9_DENNO|nr:hypothetical protein KFK09_015990 [Dendrobium nobile]
MVILVDRSRTQEIELPAEVDGQLLQIGRDGVNSAIDVVLICPQHFKGSVCLCNRLLPSVCHCRLQALALIPADAPTVMDRSPGTKTEKDSCKIETNARNTSVYFYFQ